MSKPVTIVSGSVEETRALGERLAIALRSGDVVLLSGELGAGKTVFVQGMARGLGFEGSVSSKSFVLLGEYAGRMKLYHADLYRLESPEEVQDLALEELSADGVLVVEWPERGGDVPPLDHILIDFDVTGADTRTLTMTAMGARAVEIVEALGG